MRLYLKITFPNQKSSYRFTCRENLLRKIFRRILTFLFYANPDFEGEIGNIEVWLLEFEDEESFVNREIGLDRDGNTVMKMPFKNNYGYWCDVDMPYPEYLKIFKSDSISKEYFDKKWGELV